MFHNFILRMTEQRGIAAGNARQRPAVFMRADQVLVRGNVLRIVAEAWGAPIAKFMSAYPRNLTGIAAAPMTPALCQMRTHPAQHVTRCLRQFRGARFVSMQEGRPMAIYVMSGHSNERTCKQDALCYGVNFSALPGAVFRIFALNSPLLAS